MLKKLIKSMETEYEIFLRDESRKTGEADSISFPQSEGEVKEILSHMYVHNTPVTIQGARTGIVAGSVPVRGHILNVSKMDKVTGVRYDKKSGCLYLLVQPGVLLSTLKHLLIDMSFDTTDWSQASIAALKESKNTGHWFFPPDPTEASASIGGMVSSNASGACSYFYGSTRNYISALSVVLSDGSIIRIKRGVERAKGRFFRIASDSGRIIEATLPSYAMPKVKNASGYYAEDSMDLIDLFIGSEGTLGVVTQIELKLIKKPKFRRGIISFFPSDDRVIEFVKCIRDNNSNKKNINSSSKLVAIELFNHSSLELLKNLKKNNESFNWIPDMSDAYNTAIYTEYHGNDEDSLDALIMDTAELLVLFGSGEENTWMASDDSKEMEKLRLFRHAIPEAVNMLIDQRRKLEPALTKLSTDMAVPDKELEKVYKMYINDLKNMGLECVLFGHIGNNHIHVNILPKSIEEYNSSKQLYLEWAEKVIEMGGTVSAEHGIGKLKVPLLKQMYGKEGIAQMKAVKQQFDPVELLGRGNLF